MSDTPTTGFEVGANISPFEQAMDRMVLVSHESQKQVTNDFETVNTQVAEIKNTFIHLGEQIKAAMVQAGQALRQELTESMNEAFESIKTSAKVASIVVGAAFAAAGLGAVYTAVKLIAASAGFAKGLLTGESYKSEDIKKLNEAIAVNERLRVQFSVTREEATSMALAFDAAGTSVSGYTQTAATLFGAAKGNNEAMQLLGVDTRRTGDDIADFDRISQSAITALQQYRVGTERAAAASAAGLPSYEALREAQKTTAAEFSKAREEASLYGLMISEEVVAAAEEYNTSILAFNHNTKLTWDGMSRAIADGVMPILGDLASFFKDGFPSIANATRGVVATLVSLYHGFAMSIYTVAESVLGSIKALGQGLAGVGNAIAAVVRGDFSGAWETLKQGGRNAAQEISNSFDNIAARGEQASARMRLAWLGGQEGAAPSKPSSGNKIWTPPPPPKPDAKDTTEKPERETSVMPTYELALAERRLVFERENTLMEFGKQRELDYWRDILATYEVGSKDRTSIAAKMSKLELEIMRDAAKEKRAVEQLRAEDYKAQTLDYITELEARAAFERDMGVTTEADYLARMQAFNQQRLQAELDFVAQKVAVAQLDPDANVVLLEQLEIQKLEIKRKYRALEADLSRQQTLEQTEQYRGLFSTIQGGWATSINNMLTGAQSIGQGLKSMFKTVVDSIISALAQMAAKWLIQQALMLAFGKTMGLSTIATKSAEAGAGGVASMAAAPFPLNMTAPFFGAAMAAAAASFGAVASASGGFDIPRGMNPLTQLHEEEMVLPASIANPLRDNLAAGGGAGGGAVAAGPVTFNVTAIDARGVRDFFNTHGSLIVDTVQGQRRNFKF